MIAHELRNLNESLQALAYAALGQQGPNVAPAPHRLIAALHDLGGACAGDLVRAVGAELPCGLKVRRPPADVHTRHGRAPPLSRCLAPAVALGDVSFQGVDCGGGIRPVELEQRADAETGRRVVEADRAAETRPAIVGGMDFSDTTPCRVPQNVRHDRREVRVALDVPAPKTLAEGMVDTAEASVRRARKTVVQAEHSVQRGHRRRSGRQGGSGSSSTRTRTPSTRRVRTTPATSRRKGPEARRRRSLAYRSHGRRRGSRRRGSRSGSNADELSVRPATRAATARGESPRSRHTLVTVPGRPWPAGTCRAWTGGPRAPPATPSNPNARSSTHDQTFEEWRSFAIERPSRDHELTLLALAGGEVVGVAYLEKEGFHNLTGVRRAWRGRGVASALKRAADRGRACTRDEAARHREPAREPADAPLEREARLQADDRQHRVPGTVASLGTDPKGVFPYRERAWSSRSFFISPASGPWPSGPGRLHHRRAGPGASGARGKRRGPRRARPRARSRGGRCSSRAALRRR